MSLDAATTTTPPPPSGRQVEIRHGEHVATIVEVGAAVRTYEVGGRPVFDGFGADEIAPAFHGATLMPWPNRLQDGQYSWDGVDLQVALTEPARATALHGLACWERWAFTSVAADAVTFELDLSPSPGYPFALRLSMTYAVGPDGLGVTARATNLGSTDAPYGVGFHPWLSPGAASVDECTLRLDATVRVVPDERLHPVDTEPVAGVYDLREPRPLAGVELDDAWLEPTFDANGLSWCVLAAPDGRAAAIWTDDSAKAWQVCTGDAVANPAYRRTGVAAEPMSCIADAFRTGEHLVRLAPGETHELRWGATLL